MSFLTKLTASRVRGQINKTLRSNDDIVDGNVDEFNEESDEAHDRESNGGCNGNLLEFCKSNLTEFNNISKKNKRI